MRDGTIGFAVFVVGVYLETPTDLAFEIGSRRTYGIR